MRRALRWLPALLVAVALLWVGSAAGVGLSPGVAAITVVATGLLVAVGLRQGLVLDATHAWLAALLAAAAASAALRPVAAADAAWALSVGVVSLGLLAAASRPRVAEWGAAAVVLSGALAAAWLVWQRLALGVRPPGPFGNPNPAAAIAVLAVALVPWLRMRVAARSALAAVLVAGVVASGSRGAMVALAASALASLGSRRLRLAAVVVAAVAVAGVALRLATDRDPLRWERLRIWGVAVRTAVAELPLGSGPGGFADAALGHNFPRPGEFARFHRVPTVAESDVLGVAATLGIPGTLAALGLAWRVLAVLLAAGSRGRAVAATLVVGAIVSSHLALPVVAWASALAVAGARRRPRGITVRAPLGLAVAGVLVVAVPAGVALAKRDGGIARDAGRLVAEVERATPAALGDDATLAGLEARAAQACRLRPRLGAAWRTRAELQLRRAEIRREDALAAAAVASYRQARALNATDVWAALGEGRALRRRGDLAGARRALLEAVRLEPNCAVAWQELAAVRLAGGELHLAREALARVDEARQRARRSTFVSAYEEAMIAVDEALLERLRGAVGLRR